MDSARRRDLILRTRTVEFDTLTPSSDLCITERYRQYYAVSLCWNLLAGALQRPQAGNASNYESRRIMHMTTLMFLLAIALIVGMVLAIEGNAAGPLRRPTGLLT